MCHVRKGGFEGGECHSTQIYVWFDIFLVFTIRH